MAAWAVLLFLTAPGARWAYYTAEYAAGAFPPRDGFAWLEVRYTLITLLLVSPLWVLLVGAVVRRYPGPVPLRVWDEARPVRSLVWTAVLVEGAVAALLSASWRFDPLALLSVLHAAAVAYLLLMARAALVAPRASGAVEGAAVGAGGPRSGPVV